jgi:hypothetical protein
MSEIIIGEYNVATDEEIIRPATTEEIQNIEDEIAIFEAKVAENKLLEENLIATKKAAREKLSNLGLTDDELKALGIG